MKLNVAGFTVLLLTLHTKLHRDGVGREGGGEGRGGEGSGGGGAIWLFVSYINQLLQYSIGIIKMFYRKSKDVGMA